MLFTHCILLIFVFSVILILCFFVGSFDPLNLFLPVLNLLLTLSVEYFILAIGTLNVRILELLLMLLCTGASHMLGQEL